MQNMYMGIILTRNFTQKWCANSTLEPILEEILEVLKPKQKDLATRDQVINELRRVVETVQSLRGAAVEPFGSFVSNLFTKWGDVDISINLPKEGGYISYVESDRKQRLLVDLQNPLRGRWQMVQLIPARVPILKCQSSDNIFSCDISIDNLKGQMKSKLFLWISEIDGRFRDMILLVKEWAKAHDINDPNSGTINSYSLSLLVIFHFQTCEPAIFPPLKDIYAGNVADDLQGNHRGDGAKVDPLPGVGLDKPEQQLKLKGPLKPGKWRDSCTGGISSHDYYPIDGRV
ncbi:protein heso1 [Quercus suber]|uniref:Protein heso1 n=1 Tax=Quercus suber TaxID=58331 RepID=A0AAW0JVD2_QUESU